MSTLGFNDNIVNISHYIFMSTLGFNDNIVNFKTHNKIMQCNQKYNIRMLKLHKILFLDYKVISLNT